MTQDIAEQVFETVVEDPNADGGLEKKAREAEPANFLRHVLSLSASKIADGLINPKLVLSWLILHLGAGPFWAGLLVPVRESLALLPQLFTAPRIAARPVRKWFWAFGAMGQGAAAAGIALAALTLDGTAAGVAIVGLLALLALCRSVCSASYKDVLGKTVGSSRRGTATGTASSAAAIGVIAFALLMMTGLVDRFTLVVAAIALAAALWILGGLLFTTLSEEPSEDAETQGTAAQLSHLKDDQQLRRFIAARGLLVGTALAPPFLVALQPDGALTALGGLVLASALAALTSSFVWGRLSDRSSRRVLIYAGLVAGGILALTVALHLAGLTDTPLLLPALLFGLMIAYEGVRQGRSTHLVDMAGEDQRASYTALSNTIIGVILLAAGGVTATLGAFSVPLVLTFFAVMSVAGAFAARGLEEVQQ